MVKKWQDRDSIFKIAILSAIVFGLLSLASNLLSITLFWRQLGVNPQYAHQVCGYE